MSAILDSRAREHFDAFSHAEKVEAIDWLQDIGFSDHGIAAATRLSVEQVRELLAERETEA